MSQLSTELIKQHLQTDTFGQKVVYVQQTGSTNDDLKKLARSGAPEGLVYVTDEQIAGRGRLGRQWQAPPQTSLLLSLLFRPQSFVRPHQVQRLTMLTALAMVDAIEAETDIRVSLKWPNDLIWAQRQKLAGILTEFELEGEKLSWVVIGLGLNITVDFTADPDAPPHAISLATIVEGDPPSRLNLLCRFLAQVEQRYTALKQGNLPLNEWTNTLSGIGEAVIVTDMDGTQHRGTVAGVNEDGALLLQQADDSLVTVWAGDVTLRTPTSQA